MRPGSRSAKFLRVEQRREAGRRRDAAAHALHHQLFRVAADRGLDVEVRGRACGRPRRGSGASCRAASARSAGARPRPAECATASINRPGRDVADARVAAAHQHFDDTLAERGLVEAFETLAHLQREVRGLFGAAVGHREQELQELLLPIGRQPADHAEIEQRDALVVGEQHVARMRIGVKEAVEDTWCRYALKSSSASAGAIASASTSGLTAVIFCPLT